MKRGIETNTEQESVVPVRLRAKQRKSPAKRAISGLLWVLWIGLFAFGGTVMGWLNRSTVAREVVQNFNTSPSEAFEKDAVNLLLLGCDEDLAPGGQKVLKQAGRADMILLAHLDFKKKTITGISIPRDTHVRLPGIKLPGGIDHKLNAYHNLAKPSEANAVQQKAVEWLTGVKVDRTIQLDYPAFQELIDSVGGVTLMIKDTMKYTDKAGGLYIDFKPGRRLLDGYDAMCYVRFRKDSGGDFKRTERQRQLLLAFKGQVVKNFASLPEIIEKGIAVLGGALTTREIGSLANFSKGVPQTSIKMMRLPTKPGSGSFEELEKVAATKMLKENGFLDSGESQTSQ